MTPTNYGHVTWVTIGGIVVDDSGSLRGEQIAHEPAITNDIVGDG